MGNRHRARSVKVYDVKSKYPFKQKDKVTAETARIGDASCELWIHGRARTYLLSITSTITKRKPKTKWRYDWAVEEYKKRFNEDEKPKLIAYSDTKTFQAAFTRAGKVIARKLAP